VGCPARAARRRIILLHEWIAGTSGEFAWLVKALPVVAVTLALLMVSRIPYVHFANVYLRRRQPVTRVWMFLAAAFLVVLAPQFVIPVLANAYAASGPVLWLVQLFTGPPRPVEVRGEDASRQHPADRIG
jgi:phosphatidylserine synthase